MKYLAVTLDRCVTFSDHISNYLQRARPKLGAQTVPLSSAQWYCTHVHESNHLPALSESHSYLRGTCILVSALCYQQILAGRVQILEHLIHLQFCLVCP